MNRDKAWHALGEAGIPTHARPGCPSLDFRHEIDTHALIPSSEAQGDRLEETEADRGVWGWGGVGVGAQRTQSFSFRSLGGGKSSRDRRWEPLLNTANVLNVTQLGP